ncbi:hypothetical protein J3R83DRAFT_2666 [Lanmaoa asiatica]|nr:hypothetical protein J3R83DRAFT_2666 [Lanmaoa asiatica]
MPLKRSHSSAWPNGGAVLSDQGPSKRAHADSASPTADTRETSVDQSPLRVYIISAKLLPGVLENLVSLVENHAVQHGGKVGAQNLELTADSDHADVIVTAVHTRPRLERHVNWEVARTKAIVTPDWLTDSVNSGTIQPDGKLLSKSWTSYVEPDFLRGKNEDNSDFTLQTIKGQLKNKSASNLFTRVSAYPYRFNDQTSLEDVAKLPYLGTKLTSMVEEFIRTDKISEAQKLLSSTRFLSLSVFNTIHGIGPHTARHLYSLGLRTLEDLEKYYEVTPGMTHEGTPSHLESNTREELGVEKSIQVSLTLRHDFSQKIPRQEVEEINQVIIRELELIEAGCKSIIVGGYRRGKLESNDTDIVISHTNWDHGADKVRGLCKKLVRRLHERGKIPLLRPQRPDMSGYHPHNVLRAHHWDSLEKALTVFVLPYDSARKQTYRRVDLIFATPGVFWTAVVGWTGSTMFERDLRLWAKQKKSRRHDSKLFFPKSEREVFDLLGLTYVHPTLRNADV